MTGERLLRIGDVAAIVGLSERRVYELLADNEFPSPTRIGTAVRWSLLEVEQWMTARLSERKSA